MQLKLLGIEGARSFDLVVSATSRMTKEETLAALATSGLTKEQISAILVTKGMTAAEADAAAETIVLAESETVAAGSTTAMTGSTLGLSAALKGLGTIIKSHPILAIASVIAAAVYGIANLSNSIKEAEEEEAQAAQQAAQLQKEESESLDDLIEKYKELSSLDRTDSSNREAIRNIQEEITNLVGSQAENLDLVNGKLEDQLDIIKGIKNEQLSNSIDTYRQSYTKSITQTRNKSTLHTSWGLNDLFAGSNTTIDEAYLDGAGSDKYSERLDAIKSIMKKYGGNAAPSWRGVYLEFSKENKDDFKSQLDAINELLDYFEKDIGTYQGGIYDKFVSFRDSLQEQYDNQLEQGNLYINALVEDYDNKNREEISSLEEYMAYRSKILEKLKNDGTISGMINSNVVDENDLQNQIDGYLGKIEYFSEYYNQWFDKFESDTAKGIDRLKSKFRAKAANLSMDGTIDPNDPFNLAEDKDEIEAFNKWLDSLTKEEQDIILRISEDYTHSNIKSTLEAMEKGGSVKLAVRPVIDTSDLIEAGWDGLEPGGKATVYTSTFSDENESKFINFTPIIADENGNYKGVLSPAELEKYAQDVCNGVHDDYLKLQIGAEFDSADAADAAAQKIHELHNWYFLHDDPANWGLEQFQEALDEWEIPESDKFHFSDLVSDEDFQDKVKSYKDTLSTLSDALQDLRDGSLSDDDKIELFEKFPQLASQADDLDAALVKLIDDYDTDIFSKFDEQLEYMETDDDIAALEVLRDSILNIGDTSTSVASQISKLETELDDLKDTYDDVKGVIDDYNDNGYLTLSNLQTIMDLEPQYVNLLIDENGQINLNNAAYKEYVATKAKSLLVEQLKDLYSTVLNMKLEEAQAYANAEAYDAETRSVNDLLTATTELYLIKAKQKDLDNKTTAYTDAMKRSFSTAANYAAMVDSYINSLSTSQNEFSTSAKEATSALETQKDALESEKDALEDYKDSLEDAKDALEDYKGELEDAQSSLQSLIDLTMDYIKQMKNDEKDALNDQIDALSDQKDALDEQVDTYADLISKRKEALELAKEEREEADELADKQKAVAKDTLALAVASLDDSSAGRKAQKVAADNLTESNKDLEDYLYDKSYDKQIDALEKEQEKFEETIEKQKTLIDEQVEKIESAIDEIDAYLDNERQIYEDACEMIDNDNGELYDNLWNYTYRYTLKTHAEFDKLWSDAQAAIQAYRGDNETLIIVMEHLQQKIYDTDGEIADLNLQIDECETQIGYLDDAISATSDAISSTSSSIDSVSTSLDGLGSSITDYMDQLNDLLVAAQETKTALEDVTSGDNNGEKTAFWVEYNGRQYQTGYNYNGDTTGNRYLAAAELTKLIAKDVSGFDQYGLSIVQGLLGVGTSNKRWRLWWNGRYYTATGSKTSAVKQIAHAMGMDSRGYSYVNSRIEQYASGTYGSKGGVAVTQEDGLEAIFGKLTNGKYTFMNPDSHVFTSEATENLHKFMDNPTEFISQQYGEMNYDGYLKSRYGDTSKRIREAIKSIDSHDVGSTSISAPVTVTVQGDATQSTVSALRKEAKSIEENTLKKVMRYANLYKKPIF